MTSINGKVGKNAPNSRIGVTNVINLLKKTQNTEAIYISDEDY